MKKTTVMLIVLAGSLFAGCKKEYVCECFNPSRVEKTYVIKDTKKKATAKCNDYSKEYQDIPWGESGCRLK